MWDYENTSNEDKPSGFCFVLFGFWQTRTHKHSHAHIHTSQYCWHLTIDMQYCQHYHVRCRTDARNSVGLLKKYYFRFVLLCYAKFLFFALIKYSNTCLTWNVAKIWDVFVRRLYIFFFLFLMLLHIDPYNFLIWIPHEFSTAPWIYYQRFLTLFLLHFHSLIRFFFFFGIV